MELSLQQLVPQPLKQQIAEGRSDIWQRELHFGKGEHIFVQAPSGRGKTTLIHMLYGLRTDYEGSVCWDGPAMDRLTGSQLAHLRAGYLSIVFQDLRLFPELTLWENLELKRRLMGTVSPERSEEMLRRLGIYHKKEALAGTLSYGEQQRAAIVRALLQPFDWLLMDEPFSHLDHENTQRAIHLIREVVEVNRAGFILVDLEANSHFLYHKKCYL